MSMPRDLYPTGPTAAPRVPLRTLILSALAGMAWNLRADHGYCADCTDAGGACPDHLAGLTLAAEYDAAFTQVTAGSREWADLITTLTGAWN